MTQTLVDYSCTLIYKISCKDPTVTDIYVGHTTNFVQRRDQHRHSSVNKRGKLYDVIRQNGGWTNWSMEIIHYFNCKTLIEAKTKEQEYFVALKATLNSIEPIPKKKEKMIIKKEKKEKKLTTTKDITNETTQASNARFRCDKCNYNCNKNSEFNKHLATVKHNKKKEILTEPIKHLCKCGNIYAFRQGLSLHKKTCIIKKDIQNEPIPVETHQDNNHIVDCSRKETAELKNIGLDI